MENKINIAELLEGCPKGMELYSPIFGELEFNEVNAINNRILVVQHNGYIAEFESDGRLINCKNGECLLFPSKDKTTWEGFVPPCKFKDGDVLVHTQNERFIMSIYKSNENEKLINTHVIFWDREEGLSVGMQICCYTDNVRFATEEEKQILFDSIKANGYRWNAETKTLEKLIEPKFKVGDRVRNKNYKDYIYDIHDITDKGYRAKEINADSPIIILFGSQEDNYELVPNKFDIATLKPFDSKVLVRNADGDLWKPAIYGFSHSKGCYVVGGVPWRQYIPYEANKELLGTTNNIE